MNDVIVIAILLGFFGLAAGYVGWCERIIADDRPEGVDDSVTTRWGAAVIAAAAYDNWLALGLAALVVVYLILVIVFPERF